MVIPNIKKQDKLTKEQFIGKLFSIRDSIHLSHLSVSGPGAHSAHSALNDFYDDILGKIDLLTESMQGKFGLIKIVIPETKVQDHLDLIKSLAKMTDSGSAYSLFQETWIKNQLDEISTLCYKTIYKLTFLK